MKTKIFFLLAALLLSVCAFAQSGNGTLKGDVNNDGTVDVADINAIIDIMKNGGGTGEETKCYFSIGTTEVTASNYTTVNGATTTIPTTMEYSATVRNYYYILIPSTKTLTIIGKATNALIEITEQTSAGISGHKLYKTNGALSVGGTIVITLSDEAPASNYYYYAGWTLPTADNVEEIITETYPASDDSSVMNTAGKKTTSASSMNYSTNTLYNANAKATFYVLVPNGQTIVDPEDNSSYLPYFTSQGTITVGNQTHTIYKSYSTSRYINAIKIQ